MSSQVDDLELVWQKAKESNRIGHAVTNLGTFFLIFRKAISEGSHIKIVISDEISGGLFLQVIDWQRGDHTIRFHAYVLHQLEEELLQKGITFPAAN